MASDILDRVGMVITDTGAGALVAVTASVLISNRFNTPAEAGAVNGKSYWWMLEEDNDYEIFEGVWTLATSKVTRGTVWHSKIAGVHATTRMALGGNATLRSVTPAEALNYVRFDTEQGLSAAQKDQAAVNIGVVRIIRRQIFTLSGTYIPDPNLLFADIQMVGGGGGGGAAKGAASQYYAGGGGGGGAYSRSILLPAMIGVSKPVTIGAGGAGGLTTPANGTAGGITSLGSLLTAGGGAGGRYSSTSQSPGGAAGGAAGTGDFAIPGGAGLGGVYEDNGVGVVIPSGCGGSSMLGAGAPAVASGGAANGAAGGNYGGGGSGGVNYSTNAGAAGGAGASGCVIITEYCSK